MGLVWQFCAHLLVITDRHSKDSLNGTYFNKLAKPLYTTVVDVYVGFALDHVPTNRILTLSALDNGSANFKSIIVYMG